MTVIYLMFCVEIEIYLRRGLDCCIQMRQKLSCDDPFDVTAPCRGFSGDCNDLQEAFTPLYGSDLIGFRCLTFPNPALFSDDIKSGLICAAIGIPFQVVFEMIFEHYTERTVVEGWLTWRGVARLFRGPLDWRFSRGRASPTRFTRMWARSSRTVMEAITGTVDYLWKALRGARGAAALPATRQRRISNIRLAMLDPANARSGLVRRASQAHAQAAHCDNLMQGRKQAAGLATSMMLIYITWAALTYYAVTRGAKQRRSLANCGVPLIPHASANHLFNHPPLVNHHVPITAGAVMYKLLGIKSEVRFLRDWGVRAPGRETQAIISTPAQASARSRLVPTASRQCLLHCTHSADSRWSLPPHESHIPA